MKKYNIYMSAINMPKVFIRGFKNKKKAKKFLESANQDCGLYSTESYFMGEKI